MKAEEWKDIPQNPDYAVSNRGRVKSRRSDRILRPGKAGPARRLQVRFKVGAGYRGFYVHRLVALAFIKPPRGQHFAVRHVDGDPENNAAANLRWVPWQEV